MDSLSTDARFKDSLWMDIGYGMSSCNSLINTIQVCHVRIHIRIRIYIYMYIYIYIYIYIRMHRIAVQVMSFVSPTVGWLDFVCGIPSLTK